MTRQKTFDDVYHILSGLDARNHDDALLNMLWRYKGRMDSFTLACLHSLCELLTADEVIAGYFSRLPAPNYCMARYTDWISPYLAQQLTEAAKYAGSGTATKEEKIAKVQELFAKYEAYLLEQLPAKVLDLDTTTKESSKESTEQASIKQEEDNTEPQAS